MFLAPKWIAFHLLVLVGCITLFGLGIWQLRRLDDRQSFNAMVEQRFDEPAVPLDMLIPEGIVNDSVGAGELAGSVEWRAATVSGTYLPEYELRVVNRSQNGRAGDNLVVPLELDDGRVLLVSRGFVPLGVEDPAVPALSIEVTGRLHPSQERSLLGAKDPAEGVLTEAQRLDLSRLDPQIPGDLLPVYMDLLSSMPPETPGVPEPVIAPDLSEGNHLSYAIQWFTFSLAVLAGWAVALRVSWRRALRPSTAG
jgi:surfeit locus 1 family protein